MPDLVDGQRADDGGIQLRRAVAPHRGDLHVGPDDPVTAVADHLRATEHRLPVEIGHPGDGDIGQRGVAHEDEADRQLDAFPCGEGLADGLQEILAQLAGRTRACLAQEHTQRCGAAIGPALERAVRQQEDVGDERAGASRADQGARVGTLNRVARRCVDQCGSRVGGEWLRGVGVMLDAVGRHALHVQVVSVATQVRRLEQHEHGQSQQDDAEQSW